MGVIVNEVNDGGQVIPSLLCTQDLKVGLKKDEPL